MPINPADYGIYGDAIAAYIANGGPATQGFAAGNPDAFVNGQPYWNPSPTYNPDGTQTPATGVNELAKLYPGAFKVDATNQPAAKPANINDPSADPTFLAFQRQLQASEESLRASIAKRIAASQQRVTDALPGFQTQLRRGLDTIGQNHEARGTYVSSGRLKDENQLQSDIGQQETNLRNSAAVEQGDLEGELTSGLAANQRSSAEQGIGAVDRLNRQYADQESNRATTYGNSLGDLYRKYLKLNG